MNPAAFGYLFQPSRYGTPWGHAALDVWLCAESTNGSYGVHAAEFPIFDGEIVRLQSFTHPIPQVRRRLRVSIGRFFLMPYHGTIVQGFSTGGDLEIASHVEYTWCHFTSPAPIFSLEGPLNDPVHLLVPEVEAELARLRATYGADDAKFYRELGRLDPLLTCAAALAFLHARLHILRQLIPDEQLAETSIALHAGIEAIKSAGDWPAEVPDFDALMTNGQPTATVPSASSRGPG